MKQAGNHIKNPSRANFTLAFWYFLRNKKRFSKVRGQFFTKWKRDLRVGLRVDPRRCLKFSLFFLLFGSFSQAVAKDFGVKGYVFPVEEMNLRDVLEQQAKKSSQEERKHLIKQAACPRGNAQILEASERRSYTYDPTYIAERDYRDDKGALFVKRGTRISPLKTITLDEGLLFLDGGNPEHLAWARSQSERNKWILVRGNPTQLEEVEKRPIYFDQEAKLIAKLGILAVPARVSQQGELLLIQEEPATQASEQQSGAKAGEAGKEESQ